MADDGLKVLGIVFPKPTAWKVLVAAPLHNVSRQYEPLVTPASCDSQSFLGQNSLEMERNHKMVCANRLLKKYLLILVSFYILKCTGNSSNSRNSTMRGGSVPTRLVERTPLTCRSCSSSGLPPWTRPSTQVPERGDRRVAQVTYVAKASAWHKRLSKSVTMTGTKPALRGGGLSGAWKRKYKHVSFFSFFFFYWDTSITPCANDARPFTPCSWFQWLLVQ